MRNANSLFIEGLESIPQSFKDYLEESLELTEEGQKEIQKQEISLKKLLQEYEEKNIEIMYTDKSQHYVTHPQFKEYKISRNDLCPCGSGKNIKNVV